MELYLGLKEAQRHRFVMKPFFTKKTWSVLHLNNHVSNKTIGIITGFLKRFLFLFTAYQYDYIYIYREAAVIGPPVFEWLLAKLLRKKIIFDFDDSIWVSTASEANPKAAIIKCTWKIKYICRWSHIVSVGNHFLANYASQYCKDVRVLPTVVDTQATHNQLKEQSKLPLTIGWTGTFTNFVQLDIIIPAIKKLSLGHDFTFLIIADKDPLYKEINYVYKKWNLNTEIEDLLLINIGVMPLHNTVLEMGKCAFKAIQYMSLGIPPVLSEVGANKDLVTDGVDGYFASTEQEWCDKLAFLLKSTDLRVTMGQKARSRIIDQYSVESAKNGFFSLFG